MAALGKIRSRGITLIVIIGLGLFAFIAEELFRSCESTRNDQRQQVGEVLGENISVQEFQELVDEYTEVLKVQQGISNLNDEQLNQVKDMVWNTYIQTNLIKDEAEKLGLTVTDKEMANILAEGTNQMLLNTPFVNQQTHRFDVNALKKFIADYKANISNMNAQQAEQYNAIYKYWTFTEKTLRQQLLAQKYQILLVSCFLSNPVEAKMAFNEENEEAQIQLASFPYNDIQDDKVQVTNDDIKAKYKELKSRFKQAVETRDVKYVDVEVTASATDRAAINKDFANYTKDLAAAADPTDVVRKSNSLVAYLGIPVSKDAFSADIAARLDSMAVGHTYGPVESKDDNTLNVIKLIAKQQLPDSVEYRVIQIGAQTAEEAHKTADSVYNALKAGADFEAMAKKYGQTGQKQWMTTAQYQSSPSMDKDTKGYIYSLNTMAAGEFKNIELTQGNLIVQVLDRKGFIDKYTAAVIKKTIDFSKDTYNAAYNKFSTFVSANQTADAIVKNAAKAGFKVQERREISTAEHYLAGIHSTRDALKWLFEAKEGEISPMYECGDNNHLLVVVLDKIHKKGYRPADDPQVMEMLKAEVIRDKKAEQIINKLNGVTSVAAAKTKGGKVMTVNQITFAAPVFIAATGASEPALSGAVASTAKGKFSKLPVKGNAGVYVFSVTNKQTRPAKFNENEYEQRLRQQYMQAASNFMGELYLNADVKDNRYLFF